MEKKGDVLNQFAIISDLLENANLISTETIVVFSVDKSEFNRMYNIVNMKSNRQGKIPKNSFNVKVGEVTFIFNMNNV